MLHIAVGLMDANNNKKGDKYGLRPRSRRKATLPDFEEIPLIHPKLKQKSKKSPPLSKYRRKTANARERSRMKEINQAFESLRRAVPQIAPNQQQNEKLTKITTLRLAMKYISALSAALSNPPPQIDLFSECSELDSFLLESDGESLPLTSDLSDQCLTPDFSMDFDDSNLPFDSYLDFS